MRENTTFRKFRSLIWFAVLASFACPSYAQNPIDSFPSVAQSKAYHLFKSKTDTDFAKLLFLIDRFEHSGIQVVYEGHYFDGIFAAKIARWFLARKYRKETPEDWIMRWCNTSLGGQLIYVKFPDGKFRLSREVLFDELKALNETLAEENAPSLEKKAQNPELDLLAVAGKVMASEASPSPASPKIEPPQR